MQMSGNMPGSYETCLCYGILSCFILILDKLQNGVTYDNECELTRAACVDKSRIAVKHEKTCGMSGL